MKLGICIKGYWKDELFDVDLPDAWRHNGSQHVSGFTEDYFDFDEDHIINYPDISISKSGKLFCVYFLASVKKLDMFSELFSSSITFSFIAYALGARIITINNIIIICTNLFKSSNHSFHLKVISLL